MAIQPYLFLEGRTEEAIEFYRQALGAEVEILLRMKDAPEEAKQQRPVPPEHENKIMHATLRVGEDRLLLSDGMNSGQPQFKGFALSLVAADRAEAEKLFNGLAQGGQVQMPLGPTFFAPAFGMVGDRFGVSWMVIVNH